MLDPRSIATQGFGLGARPIALQGFTPATATVEPDEPFVSRGSARRRVVEQRIDNDDDLLFFLL